jgi:hypothetical protein
MSTKTKPIKVVVTVYGCGVVTGLVLSIIGIIFKLHALIEIGLGFFIFGVLVGSIPLLGYCAYLVWKKMQLIFRQKQ